MDVQVRKVLKNVSLVLFIILILWIFLMILSNKDVDPNWEDIDYLRFVSKPNPVFILNYLNAVLFTCLAVVLLGLLYLYTRETNKILAFIGILFVPIYGLINLVVYSAQITILPLLTRGLDFAAGDSSTVYFIAQFLHKEGTVFGMLNASAYAIVGIPSILFG